MLTYYETLFWMFLSAHTLTLSLFSAALLSPLLQLNFCHFNVVNSYRHWTEIELPGRNLQSAFAFLFSFKSYKKGSHSSLYEEVCGINLHAAAVILF